MKKPHMMPEILSGIFSTNSSIDEGELHVAGVAATTLAEEFGTPLFVVDESDFKERALAWKEALTTSFGVNAGTVYYAGKAFLCKEIVRWVHEVEIGLDVCTGGELAVAAAVQFPMEKVEVHGNNKSEDEIRSAILLGAGTIVLDSFHEIDRVAKISAELGVIQRVYIRVTPGVVAHTHEFIATAHEDVKFGFSIADGSAWSAIEKISSAASLNLVGLHSHIGSQIFASEGFAAAAKKLITLLANYKNAFGHELAELDLGGGYGIAYVPGEETLNPFTVLTELAAVVNEACAESKIAVPRISIEPGRAIVGPTTLTLYTVGTTKVVHLDDGISRQYVAVDGGMSDNIRPALYDAEYIAILANRKTEAGLTNSRVVGKHCESGDVLISQIDLPVDIRPGDLVSIPATGAYGRSMASNYNHTPRPAVVAVIEGKARVIVRREEIADLLALDL
jgi:diaminopimelate decarboxylase